MSSTTQDEIAKKIKHAQDEIIPSNPILDNILTNSTEKGIPPIAVGPSHGQLLSILCASIHAKAILEVGTLGGYSTHFLAHSVPGCHVTSLELRSHHRDVALENLSGVKNVDILLGPGVETLPKLAEQGKVFDFVFIDADNVNQHIYYEWAVKLVRRGGLIYVDNAVRRFTDWEKGKEGFNLVNAVKGDQRVRATLIPTLNYGSVYRAEETSVEKQIDGFLIAVKL